MTGESRRRAELLAALGRELRRYVDQNAALSQSVAERLGLNATDLRCVVALSQGGPVTAGQLAELTGLTTGAVTGIIDRLEEAGFARRTKDPSDRRQVIVDAGGERRGELDQLMSGMTKALQGVADDFKDEQLSAVIDFAGRAAGAVQRESERLRQANVGQGAADGRQEASAPLGRATRGLLRFSRGGYRVTIKGDPSLGELYRARFEGRAPQVRVDGGEVTFTYSRFSIFDARKQAVEVTLNASIPWALELKGGMSKLDADLSLVPLLSVEITGGASDVELVLPEPKSRVAVELTGGASDITIHRPRGVGAKVEVRGGLSQLQLDEQALGAVGGTARLVSRDYRDNGGRYDVQVQGGASEITVDAKERRSS